MLVAIATFTVLVALWGSPAVHATLRGWVGRLASRIDPDGSEEPPAGSPARVRVEPAPRGPSRA
jgi:hypothetical protein